MRNALPLMLSLSLTTASALAAPPPADSGNVRIYRCVSSTGTVALQDEPCRSGQQQVLDMQRPKDPPARRVSSDPAAPPPVAPPEREVRYVMVQPPQPMYECIDGDGGRYTSDDNEGNPRWVSVWGGGYVGGYHGDHGGGITESYRGSFRGGYQGSRVGVQIGGGGQHGPRPLPPDRPRPPHGPRPPGGGHTPYPGVAVPVGNVLVRDQCHALPQQEVCSRLQDRRWELVRRYNSALQSERTVLTREQRSVDARLERDCRGG